LSHYVDVEDPAETTVICSTCKTSLRLCHADQWDEDLGFETKFFWFEKV
jgi:hypothetical protein